MSASRPQTILVIGLGELGKAVLDSLLEYHRTHGTKTVIFILLRPSTAESTDPAKRSQINEYTRQGIFVLKGDISNDSEANLASTFKGFDVVIGCSGMTNPSGTQLKVARAVVSAQVRKYVPWQFGLDYDTIGRGSGQDLFDEQLDVRDLLRSQSQTSWVVISTGIFMSFLFEPGFGVVDDQAKLVRGLGGLDNRVTVTSVEDIGTCVAEIILGHPSINDQIVFVAGDTISYGELARALSERGGVEYTAESWTSATLEQELREEPTDGMRKYRLVLAAGKGVAWEMKNTFNYKKQVEMHPVKRWLAARTENIGKS